MACFAHGPGVVTAFRERFQPHLAEDQVEAFVDGLVASAVDNVSTTLYDNYQFYANGIL